MTTTEGYAANLPYAEPRQNGTADNFHSPEDILTSSTFIKETCLKLKNLAVRSQAVFTVLLQHYPGGILTRHGNSRHRERDLNSRPSRLRSEVLPTASLRRIVNWRRMNDRSER